MIVTLLAPQQCRRPGGTTQTRGHIRVCKFQALWPEQHLQVGHTGGNDRRGGHITSWSSVRNRILFFGLVLGLDCCCCCGCWCFFSTVTVFAPTPVITIIPRMEKNRRHEAILRSIIVVNIMFFFLFFCGVTGKNPWIFVSPVIYNDPVSDWTSVTTGLVTPLAHSAHQISFSESIEKQFPNYNHKRRWRGTVTVTRSCRIQYYWYTV